MPIHTRHIAAALFAAVLAAAPAPVVRACDWSSMTLFLEGQTGGSAEERIGRAITGAYPVFPKLYFEERIRAIEAKGTLALEDYDDAAMASDRLGRHDDGLAWLAKKRVALDALPADNATRKKHEYRYLANLGTVHAHRWVANGASASDTADLKAGRDRIAEAIRLNPDAHFGREIYQLEALDWLLAMARGDGAEYAPIAADDDSLKAAEGFAGLMIQGTASRSFDVWLALCASLDRCGETTLARLAALRMEELRSLHPQAGRVEDQLLLLKRYTAIGDAYPVDEEHRQLLAGGTRTGRDWTAFLGDDSRARALGTAFGNDFDFELFEMQATQPNSDLDPIPYTRAERIVRFNRDVPGLIPGGGLAIAALAIAAASAWRRRREFFPNWGAW